MSGRYELIAFENVVKRYPDGTLAIDHLSFTAPAGKITVLVGPSGCGKTTTLRMVNRLIEPTSGRILLGGEDTQQLTPTAMRRNIGYVIQNAGLFPHRTVLDNVCAVPFLQKADKQATRKRAMELLELVGLDASYAKRYPWQLSGGQQQRVGVARALAADPPYMLMDEPFSAVDPIVRKQLQSEFLSIQAKLAKTIIMVTHDIDEALRMGDQIVVLRTGGRIAQIGTPAEILANPEDPFVADFLGDSRGYHALSFEPLGAVNLTETTSLAPHKPAPSTEEIWVVATDAEERPIGWVQTDHVAPEGHSEPDITTAPTVSLADGNYRELLDAALASPSGQAIVVNEDETYAGTVQLEDVIRGSVQALADERHVTGDDPVQPAGGGADAGAGAGDAGAGDAGADGDAEVVADADADAEAAATETAAADTASAHDRQAL